MGHTKTRPQNYPHLSDVQIELGVLSPLWHPGTEEGVAAQAQGPGIPKQMLSRSQNPGDRRGGNKGGLVFHTSWAYCREDPCCRDWKVKASGREGGQTRTTRTTDRWTDLGPSCSSYRFSLQLLLPPSPRSSRSLCFPPHPHDSRPPVENSLRCCFPVPKCTREGWAWGVGRNETLHPGHSP